MIIDINSPHAYKTMAYGKYGELVGPLVLIDTNAMIGKQLVFDQSSGKVCYKTVKLWIVVYDVMRFERKRSGKIFNTNSKRTP